MGHAVGLRSELYVNSLRCQNYFVTLAVKWTVFIHTHLDTEIFHQFHLIIHHIIRKSKLRYLRGTKNIIKHSIANHTDNNELFALAGMYLAMLNANM